MFIYSSLSLMNCQRSLFRVHVRERFLHVRVGITFMSLFPNFRMDEFLSEWGKSVTCVCSIHLVQLNDEEVHISQDVTLLKVQPASNYTHLLPIQCFDKNFTPPIKVQAGI